MSDAPFPSFFPSDRGRGLLDFSPRGGKFFSAVFFLCPPLSVCSWLSITGVTSVEHLFPSVKSLQCEFAYLCEKAFRTGPFLFVLEEPLLRSARHEEVLLIVD